MAAVRRAVAGGVAAVVARRVTACDAVAVADGAAAVAAVGDAAAAVMAGLCSQP